MIESLQGKLTTLRQIISDMQSVLVAYSGGIDSTVVLKIAHEQLGEQALGLTAVSPTFPIGRTRRSETGGLRDRRAS